MDTLGGFLAEQTSGWWSLYQLAASVAVEVEKLACLAWIIIWSFSWLNVSIEFFFK